MSIRPSPSREGRTFRTFGTGDRTNRAPTSPREGASALRASIGGQLQRPCPRRLAGEEPVMRGGVERYASDPERAASALVGFTGPDVAQEMLELLSYGRKHMESAGL